MAACCRHSIGDWACDKETKGKGSSCESSDKAAGSFEDQCNCKYILSLHNNMHLYFSHILIMILRISLILIQSQSQGKVNPTQHFFTISHGHAEQSQLGSHGIGVQWMGASSLGAGKDKPDEFTITS